MAPTAPHMSKLQPLVSEHLWERNLSMAMSLPYRWLRSKAGCSQGAGRVLYFDLSDLGAPSPPPPAELGEELAQGKPMPGGVFLSPLAPC